MGNAPGDEALETPFGTFRLHAASGSGSNLRAWNAADRLLLAAVAESARETDSLLCVNDSHGALSLPLATSFTWTDSAIALQAIRNNANANGVPVPHFIKSTEPPAPVNTDISTVVLRAPKQLAYFEFQLNQLARHLPNGTVVYAAGMDKHLSPHTANLLEKHIGATERHRGKHKARLFTSVLERAGCDALDPERYFFCEPLDAALCNLPNGFSQEKLDSGAALLIKALSALEPADTVIDLACGNGVLGLFAARQGARSIIFCDESAHAIEAATRNCARLLLGDSNAGTPGAAASVRFHWGDGLREYTGAKVQRILVNPPFHAGHTVDEAVGKRLLAQCSKYLEPGGDLLLVANRHLNYRPTLKKRFSHITPVAQDNKFVVLRAIR